MTPDRTLAPDFQVITNIELPQVQSTILPNGLDLHVLNLGEQPVMRLECIFDAGTWYESAPNAAYYAIKMLTEGTSSRSSSQISEAFERLGAFVEMSPGADRVGILVYCLSRVLPDVLEIVTDLVQYAAFPEHELEEQKNITIQNLRVNMEKTAYLASTTLKRALFGNEHPYGKVQLEGEIRDLKRETILDHYNNYIKNAPCSVIMAGQVSENDVALVAQSLGSITAEKRVEKDAQLLNDDYAGKQILVEKANTLQSSIRLGRRMFTRSHPDYFPMLVTNEIFGGYFGSRLMKNIREDKGLTYGISSHLVSMSKAGYLMIGTDAKKEFTQLTIDEIKKEMLRLQTELVGDDELQTVKNFMAGELAGSLNTAFEIADKRKTILLEGLPADFYEQYLDSIHATTAEQVMAMAQQYLRPEDMLEVVVGGK
ncbi:putative Zn-dependent peptidase [Dyadobacter jejuensis]|uniref:Putative Zn-dependent peptidase n=1 Tax=Dyadobacter jejuensis TaxID=1082580 RepID=A0A316AU67_9BACT|nr:pitrilysin family protein [Dyadobacter jejuensis]PWJ60230.1 putative Zn-dependent peptidase [Dyadobacter jejuensis]